MRSLFNIVMAIAIISGMLSGCGKKKTDNVIATAIDPDSMPTMVTKDVTTLISDSGMTKYRITSKLWIVYDEAKTPVWKFPTGLYLEKLDDKFKTEAHIECDSATYFKRDKLWRLDGNVRISNVKKELILTEQLFWSQSLHKVYSDSFIHIEKSDRIIEGYGFTSNERMTTYLINKPSGIFPIDENRAGGLNK